MKAGAWTHPCLLPLQKRNKTPNASRAGVTRPSLASQGQGLSRSLKRQQGMEVLRGVRHQSRGHLHPWRFLRAAPCPGSTGLQHGAGLDVSSQGPCQPGCSVLPTVARASAASNPPTSGSERGVRVSPADSPTGCAQVGDAASGAPPRAPAPPVRRGAEALAVPWLATDGPESAC